MSLPQTTLRQFRLIRGFENRLNNYKPVAQSFRFYVEIMGILCAEFLECSGISAEREVEEIEEGGVNDFVHRLPGRIKYQNIVLKRGITYDRDLWEWFKAGEFDGCVHRVNMSIIIGNAELRKVKQWDVYDAYPVRWSSTDLSTDSLQVAIETLEIAHHGIATSYEEGNPLSGAFAD